MVHAVVPAHELATHVRDVADRLARIPRELLARVKHNLNQAEDTDDRRRFLFANEANNQIEAGRSLRARMGRGA